MQISNTLVLFLWEITSGFSIRSDWSIGALLCADNIISTVLFLFFSYKKPIDWDLVNDNGQKCARLELSIVMTR